MDTLKTYQEKSSYIIYAWCLMACSALVMAETQNEEELKPVFKLTLPSFKPYTYKGQDTDIIKYLDMPFVDEEATSPIIINPKPANSQQSTEQPIGEAFNIESIAIGNELTNELTIDYFKKLKEPIRVRFNID
ncbi:MAG: hypothetical protein ACOX6X_08880 [Dethiobacteria bacterium]|jgi:hypothetical protein